MDLTSLDSRVVYDQDGNLNLLHNMEAKFFFTN